MNYTMNGFPRLQNTLHLAIASAWLGDRQSARNDSGEIGVIGVCNKTYLMGSLMGDLVGDLIGVSMGVVIDGLMGKPRFALPVLHMASTTASLTAFIAASIFIAACSSAIAIFNLIPRLVELNRSTFCWFDADRAFHSPEHFIHQSIHSPEHSFTRAFPDHRNTGG